MKGQVEIDNDSEMFHLPMGDEFTLDEQSVIRSIPLNLQLYRYVDLFEQLGGEFSDFGRIIENQKYFVNVLIGDEQQLVFVPALWRAILQLVVRLTDLKTHRVSRKSFDSLFAFPDGDGMIRSYPEIFKWAENVGMVTSLEEDVVGFPLVYLIGEFADSCREYMLQEIQNIANIPLLIVLCSETKQDRYNQIFDGIPYKIKLTILARTEPCSSLNTLAAIARILNCTRERVRQYEKSFLKSLETNSQLVRNIARSFINDYISTNGKRIFEENSREINWRRFLSWSLGIDSRDLAELGVVACIGDSANELLNKYLVSVRKAIKESRIIDILDIGFVRKQLISDQRITLMDSDYMEFAARLVAQKRRTMSKELQVAYSLDTIGRPSHYSEITEKFNELFPNTQTTAHNLHAILDREKYGIVWVGVKGTYAFAKWGYSRPDASLWEQVIEIVNTKYANTNRPIHCEEIIEELGKKRKIFSLRSVECILNMTSCIRRVSRYEYIPNTAPNSNGKCFPESAPELTYFDLFEDSKG